ncbi:MAG: hypothetical protein R3C53_16455 [Pirellulaceae bacterium]
MQRTDEHVSWMAERFFSGLVDHWEQRPGMLRSAEAYSLELRSLDARIHSYTDGLVQLGAAIVPRLVAACSIPPRAQVAASAFALLHFDLPPAQQALIASIETAEGEVADGLVDALPLGPIQRLEPLMSRLLDSDRPLSVAIAAHALASHHLLATDHPCLTRLIRADEPDIRRRGWQIYVLASMP